VRGVTSNLLHISLKERRFTAVMAANPLFIISRSLSNRNISGKEPVGPIQKGLAALAPNANKESR
jgi:hypothetical protein